MKLVRIVVLATFLVLTMFTVTSAFANPQSVAAQGGFCERHRDYCFAAARDQEERRECSWAYNDCVNDDEHCFLYPSSLCGSYVCP